MKLNQHTAAPPIVLYLMGQKGFEVLKIIANKYVDIIGTVVSEKDPNLQKDYFNEICNLCKEYKIPFLTREQPLNIKPRYAFAISWRWLIKLEQIKLIVFHDSLLPRYRGFNPLVTCLINGEPKIGVTALFASNDYDKGDIIAQAFTEISYPIKIQKAIDLITENYVELALSILNSIVTGNPLSGTPQNESFASYSLWRDEDDYCIDWSKPACYIKRFVDAVGYPYLGASTKVNGVSARVLEVSIFPDDLLIENRTPGKVIFIKDGFPVVVCGKGLITIKKLLTNDLGQSMLPLKMFRTRFT